MELQHQTRVLFQSSLLRVEDYRCREGKSIKPRQEWAGRHEIVIPRSGAFIRRDAGGSFVADLNTILYFNRAQPYEISHPAARGDLSTVFVVQPAVLLDLLRAVDPGVEERPESPFTTGHVVLDTRLRFLQYWLLQAPELDAVEPLEIEERVLILLAELMRRSVRSRNPAEKNLPPATAREHAELVERVKLLLSRRFRERLTLNEISRAVSCSPYHLCRIFKRATGLPIHQYMQRLRLVAALEPLAEGRDHSLARIALDLGFASHNHFSSAFHKQFGLAPSEYRRSVRSRDLRELSNILKA